jgi:hypothetical protein
VKGEPHALEEDLSFWKRVSAILALIAMMAVAGHRDHEDAEVTASLESEASDRKAIRPCDLTIAQFGAGEAYWHRGVVYECASGTRNPPHILTVPVEIKHEGKS